MVTFLSIIIDSNFLTFEALQLLERPKGLRVHTYYLGSQIGQQFFGFNWTPIARCVNLHQVSVGRYLRTIVIGTLRKLLKTFFHFFTNPFGQISVLCLQGKKVGKVAVLSPTPCTMFYVITKILSSGKPTYPALRRSLVSFRIKVTSKGIGKLAIPRHDCGLDRLDWLSVRQMIRDVFQDVPLEILVCSIV